MKQRVSKMKRLKYWLSTLSFRTGIIILSCCIPFYILSFAQIALSFSNILHSVLWVILFGLAKVCQYTGLAILGAEGIKRIKRLLKNKES